MNGETENSNLGADMQAFKQVNPANPFVVPDGYFEKLEGAIMNSVKIDEFKQKHQGDGFAVPENYFECMGQNIQSLIAIDDLLNNKDGFIVPTAYFKESAGNIESFINVDEAVNQKHGFNVPLGYFEQLERNIQSRIALEELIPADGFIVPNDYFEGLEASILNRIAQSDSPVKANQQGVIRKLWTSTAFKYASAACFSLVMGTAIFMSEFNDGQALHNRSFLHKELSQIPKSDIEDYLQMSGDSPSLMENADLSDLKQVTGLTDKSSN